MITQEVFPLSCYKEEHLRYVRHKNLALLFVFTYFCGRPFLSMLLLLRLVYFLLFQSCLKTLSIFISAKESTPHTLAGGPGVKDTFDLYVDGIDNIPDSSTIVKVYFNFVFSQEGGGREVHSSKSDHFDQHHTTLLP